MAKSDTSRRAGLQWISGGVGQYAVQCGVGISTFALGITVTAMAVAAGKFKAAPKSAETEAAAVAAKKDRRETNEGMEGLRDFVGGRVRPLGFKRGQRRDLRCPPA